MMISHLACAAAPAHPLNETQRLRFIEACARFPGARRSLAASAGALLGPNFAFDMLRPGIGLYGGGPFDAENPPLAPVATLQAPILQLRDIGVGETIGYGATYSAPARARIATCAIGYADGLLRSLSGKGYGYLRGTACPFRGRVSMDLVTLDVSGVRDVRVATTDSASSDTTGSTVQETDIVGLISDLGARPPALAAPCSRSCAKQAAWRCSRGVRSQRACSLGISINSRGNCCGWASCRCPSSA